MTALQLVRYFVAQNATSAVSGPATRDELPGAWENRTHTTPRRSADLEVGGAADLAFNASLAAEYDAAALI